MNNVTVEMNVVCEHGRLQKRTSVSYSYGKSKLIVFMTYKHVYFGIKSM